MFLLQVTRTSQDSEKEPPCEEAILLNYVATDELGVDDPNKLNDKRVSDNWYTKGRNHRVENGHIKRDYDTEGYFVRFDNIDDLFSFIKKYGGVVIEESLDSEEYMRIEIYDDWRE